MAGGQTTRWLMAACLGVSTPAFAQVDAAPVVDQPAAEVTSDGRQTFSQAELDELLAPIALYPDPLLTQVLMASTYPLEIVQADRWAKANPSLQGDTLATALAEQRWDPSVKSLINSPTVLAMMSDKLDWTIRLGDAFIGQEKQVMNTVQDLRARAQAAGNLKDNAQQRVVIQDAPQQAPPDNALPPAQELVREKVIMIEPAQPEVVYVPVYDPIVTYGTWWQPYYRPFFYCPPAYPYYGGISFGISFSYGAAWGYAWGYPDWHHGHCHVDVHQHSHYNHHIDRRRYQAQYDHYDDQLKVDRNTWVHDPNHRRGVKYRGDAGNRFAPIDRTPLRNAINSYAGGNNFIRPQYPNHNKPSESNFIKPTERSIKPTERNIKPSGDNFMATSADGRQIKDPQQQGDDTDRVKIVRNSSTIRPRIERSIPPAASSTMSRVSDAPVSVSADVSDDPATPAPSDSRRIGPSRDLSNRLTERETRRVTTRQTPAMMTFPQIRDSTPSRNAVITRSAAPAREPTAFSAGSQSRMPSATPTRIMGPSRSPGVSASSPRASSMSAAPAPRATIARSSGSANYASFQQGSSGGGGGGRRGR